MGNSASVNTTTNQITQNISNELVNKGSSSSVANCNVKIGDISFTKTHNCRITVKNQCLASAETSIESMLQATSEVTNNLDNSSKAAAAEYFKNSVNVNTTSNDINTIIKNYTENECKAEAEANANLEINNIIVKECSADTVMSFDFINAGHVQAQCLMKAVMDTASGAATDITNKSEAGGDPLWTTILYVAIIGAVIAIVGLLVKAFTSGRSAGETEFERIAKRMENDNLRLYYIEKNKKKD